MKILAYLQRHVLLILSIAFIVALALLWLFAILGMKQGAVLDITLLWLISAVCLYAALVSAYLWSKDQKARIRINRFINDTLKDIEEGEKWL